MKLKPTLTAIAFALGAGIAPFGASAFDAGSTGADGAFNPTVNTTVPLPPSGIFNYTSVNIPAGITVTFVKNTVNAPVVILASGDVTVAGTINLNGTTSNNTGAAGNGNLGDDGVPGVGGPGGFDGGPASIAVNLQSAAGLGPGGGAGGNHVPGFCFCGGGGGGFGATGSGSSGNNFPGGAAYGSVALLPLIGGSGGGGGATVNFRGSGGGGGGGAILIAASGTVNVTGSITANGGGSGSTDGVNSFGTGGGGSGGAIRIVATTIAGNGTLSATGGTAPGANNNGTGGTGAVGRIRLESEIFQRTAASNPAYTFASPGPVFVAGTPTLAITSVAGVAAPTTPTGNADITLPSTTANPVAVTFATTGVPVGNTVQLTVVPMSGGAKTVVVSPALTGSTANATASVNVNLASGPSVLQAQTTYTVTAAVGDLLKNYAGNERVERVTLAATLGGPQKVTLVTVTGREFEVPAEVLRIAALGG